MVTWSIFNREWGLSYFFQNWRCVCDESSSLSSWLCSSQQVFPEKFRGILQWVRILYWRSSGPVDLIALFGNTWIGCATLFWLARCLGQWNQQVCGSESYNRTIKSCGCLLSQNSNWNTGGGLPEEVLVGRGWWAGNWQQCDQGRCCSEAQMDHRSLGRGFAKQPFGSYGCKNRAVRSDKRNR